MRYTAIAAPIAYSFARIPMEETKITSSIANLDVEIVRKEYPEENAEVMTIKLQATPSFEAVSRSMLSPFSSPFLFNPLTTWAQMMKIAWSPLLSSMVPRIQVAQTPQAPRVQGPADPPGSGGQAGQGGQL